MAKAKPDETQEYGVTPEELRSFLVMVGKNVKSWRETFSMTQEQLARSVGVSVYTVHKWEQGYAVPRPESLISLGKVFDLQPSELLSIDMEEATEAVKKQAKTRKAK